jgi:hypothetical protein
VNQFVAECRREWKRLRVPDPVADEMAADLEADLNEAQHDGVSPEDVLGRGAADPRSFAASWARERGVVPPPSLTARLPRSVLMLAAIAAFAAIAVGGASLVIFDSPEPSAPEPVLFAPPDDPVTVPAPAVPPLLDFDLDTGSGAGVHVLGSILLVVGIAGLILATLVLLGSSRATTALRS